MNPPNQYTSDTTTGTTIISISSSISDCIRCLLHQTMVVVATNNLGNEDDYFSQSKRPEKWLNLRHGNHHFQYHHEPSYFLGSTTITTTTTTHALQISISAALPSPGSIQQEHRALVIHHHQLRGLHYIADTTSYMGGGARNAGASLHSSSMMNTITSNEPQDLSAYLSTDDTANASGAFAIVSIVSCILIVLLFLWLGYCACWFGFGGVDTEPTNEETMATEKRKKYLARVLVCKKYSSPQIEIPTREDFDADHSTPTRSLPSTDEHGQDANSPIKIPDSVDLTRLNEPTSLAEQSSSSSMSSSPQCAICLEHFIDGDIIFETSSIMNVECKHIFHQHCIYEWCMVQTNCPCCRRELIFRNHRDINYNDDDDDDPTEPNDSYRSDP